MDMSRIDKIAMQIVSDAEYRYDPEHKSKPQNGGSWRKTLRGWSRNMPVKNIKPQRVNYPDSPTKPTKPTKPISW